MDWLDPIKNPPPQGYKVLCFRKGDIWVAIRYGKYWLPIPFLDSQLADIDPPDLYQRLSLPEGYLGRQQAASKDDKDNIMDMDEFEKHYPLEFQDWIRVQVDYWKKKRKKK